MKVGEPACRVKSQGNEKTVIGRARGGEEKVFQLISSTFIQRTYKSQFDTRLKDRQKAVLLCKTENYALSQHACQTNYTISVGQLYN